MLVPLLTVLALWGAWSVGWVVISQIAQEKFAQWREKSATKGLSLVCAKESWGGYPFRIEVGCNGFALEKKNKKSRLAIEFQSVDAVAQAYKPWHIILKLTAPLKLELSRGGGSETTTLIKADHQPSLASVVLKDRINPEVSILFEKISGSITDQAGAANFSLGDFQIEKLNLHGRIERELKEGQADYAVAATADTLHYDGPLRDPADGGPIKLDAINFNGIAERLPMPLAANLQKTLRIWAANEGRLKINQLEVKQEAITARSSGFVTASQEGQLSGKVKTAVLNLDNAIDKMVTAGRLTANDAKISKGLFKMLSGNNPNGEVITDFRIKNGKLYFGPFKLLKLAPIFKPN
ncbi:MAG: DUF2125 domain-containing protein [Alphaproteobacteria bacterium]|nr:DUF2125 domain-containing protein [Alphaproteobacteria bacterium]